MSGGVKFDEKKIAIGLIPTTAILEMAKAFTEGAAKYGSWNYMQGMSATRLTSAAQRHLIAWSMGESYDPETGIHHLGCAMAECAMALQLELTGNLQDDRYKIDVPSLVYTPTTKRGTAVEMQANYLQLEAGKTYLTRSGLRVEIKHDPVPDDFYCFIGSNRLHYSVDGRVYDDRVDPLDLIRESREPLELARQEG